MLLNTNTIRVTMQQIGSWNRDLIQYFKDKEVPIVRAGLSAKEDMEQLDFDSEFIPDFDLFERSDYWTSCSYFYLDKPENDLPIISDVKERVKSIPDFNEEALYDMNNELPEVRMVSKYVPDLINLSLDEIKELQFALQVVINVLSNQEKALEKE